MMINPKEDNYGIKELQNKILEIAIYIDDFCTKHNIEYCLMGGSALGAKRHQGFIPWDDDLDIFMTTRNYEKFRSLFIRQGDSKNFYLQQYGLQKNGNVTVPKLRMNGTTYIEELTKDWKIHQGIFVDIFILHTCPNSFIKRLWQYFWAKCVVVKGMSMRKYNRQKGFRQFLVNIAKFLPKRIMINYALNQVYKYDSSDSSLYCNFLGKASYRNGIYKKKWFEKTEYVPFEYKQLRVPLGLNDFLRERFGNYMIIPDENKIKWEQHSIKWDTKNDFSKYTNNERLFTDETKLA